MAHKNLGGTWIKKMVENFKRAKEPNNEYFLVVYLVFTG